MKTPFFLIDYEKLAKNVKDFQDALQEVWPNSKLAYSVKTNSLPWILKYLHKKNVLAEVVSDEEYQLAKLCGYLDAEIVYNGPIKGEQQLKSALNGRAYVNLDSAKDLKVLKECDISEALLGIRINIPPYIFEKEDIGYETDGFRFGFSEENGELKKIFDLISSMSSDKKIGLHLHCNSITRSLDVYRTIARYAASLINKYQIKPIFIDMGGGYFGGVEGKPTPIHYIQIIKEELSSVIDVEDTMLIVEPGSAIVGSVVELHTSVIDVKDTELSRIVTTDGSRIHIDPLWAKSRYMYSTLTKNTNRIPKQIICGYTCMDHDRIMTLDNSVELSVGDKVIYYRVGAYSMTFGGMFIRYFPEVYVKKNDEFVLVRKRISVDDYYNIQKA